MKTTLTTLLILLIFFTSCDEKNTDPIKMIPISTEYGDFNVWTKRVGNNPSKKVLLLMGVQELITNILKDLNLIFQEKK
jgi:proline iminopeptidase